MFMNAPIQCAVIPAHAGIQRRRWKVTGSPLSYVDERGGGYTRSQLNLALLPVPKTFNAPDPPTAFGRMKIQFCHAERRPKTRVSIVSTAPKRRFASMPVSASGDR